jgi:hypothetical protein
VRNDSDQEIQVPVRLLLDGQALAGEQQTPSIAARSETMLEFDHSIRPHGTHVLSVEAESKDDAIAVDNVSHAAVHVADSLSVLLVNGTSAAAAADRDTFFAELAFAPPEGKAPWVNARVIDAVDLQPSDFESMAVVIFCNVDQISPAAAIALAEFVAKGNGAIIACGPNTTPEKFRQSFGDSDLLPQLEIVRTREAPPQAEEQVHVAPLSIQPGWLERFRSDPARSFLKATFSAWCLTKLSVAKKGDGFVAAPGAPVTGKQLPEQPSPTDPSSSATPIILAQLSTGDPLILQSRHQNGYVLIVTTTLNREWTDLPTRSDFVPFLHEAVFHVASARSHRNVRFAEPLVVRVPAAKPTPDAPANTDAVASETSIVFTAPDGSETPLTARPDSQSLVAVQVNTFAPGIYQSSFAKDDAEPVRDAFVVNYDHSEDNLAQLTVDDRARLATNDRVRFSSSLDDLTKRMYGDESVTELWAILMTTFLLFLITELLLTRRAIRKGYGGESLAAT